MADEQHDTSAGEEMRPRRWRWRRWGMLCLMLLFGGPWLFIWVATHAPGPVVLPTADVSRRYDVYLMRELHHTAIIVEQPDGWRLGPPGEQNAKYVQYAWGDRRYYKDSDRRRLTIVTAVLMPTDAVVYVRGRDELPRDVPLYRRSVTAPELTSLARGLEESFERTDDGQRVEPYPPVDRYHGRFYASRQYYIFWNNCNGWTVARLAEADLAGTSLGVTTSRQAAGRLKGFSRVGDAAR